MPAGGFRVVLDLADKEKPRLRSEVADPLHARLQQLEHRKKPRMPISEVRVIPQTRGLKRWFDTLRKIVGREQGDVLLVEPIELSRIEHGAAAADAVEREPLDQLFRSEQ